MNTETTSNLPEKTVTVLLPVYNAEKYLKKAIDSILNQTFTDFELLIINDGSRDSSEEIIFTYDDKRIRYHKNEQNIRLIRTLNNGIEMARGKYIARMDADDICLPTRLEKQVQYLEKHPETALLFSRYNQIDARGKSLGEWPIDAQNVRSESIKAYLPISNCLGHPTLMARTEILKKYKFPSNQLHIEDYALWLEMLSDGHMLEKYDEILLKYRVFDESVSAADRKKNNPDELYLSCQLKYLRKRIFSGTFTAFDKQVFWQVIKRIYRIVMRKVGLFDAIVRFRGKKYE